VEFTVTALKNNTFGVSMNNMMRQSSRSLSSTLFAILTMLLCHGTMNASELGLTDTSTNPPPAAVPAPEGIVGWWRGEGNDVDIPSDPSGMGTNAVTYGPGKVGNGFSFDGVNTTLYAIASPVLNIGPNQNFSIEGWIQTQPNLDNIRGIAIIAEKTAMPLPGISAGWQLYIQNGLLSIKLMQRPTLEENHWTASGPDLRDGQFHHVAAVLDRNTANSGKLYVDGSPVLTFDATQQSGDLYTEGPLLIGCANYTYNAIFKGIIDELSLYNRALTDSEILSVYNAAGSGKILTPSIVTHPANLTVNDGQAALFNVDGVGRLPLSYQWSFNGTNIVGATNSSLNLNKVQLADAGVYNVVVSNNSGSITSSNAVLKINALPPAAVPAPAGMVAWWKGESNVVDVLSGLSGFVTNGAGYGPGKVGTGMSFDGVYGRVCIPDSPILHFGSNQNFSVEAWIQAQPNSANVGGIAVIADKTDTFIPGRTVGWQFYLENGRLGFKLMQRPTPEENHWTASGPDLRDGQFHHVAAVLDRNLTNSGRLYVDGSPALTFDATQQPGDLYTEGMFLIGSGNIPDVSEYFKGVIDEVSLYGRALSDADILSIYNAAGNGKVLVTVAPSISKQPADQELSEGNYALFSVVANGSELLSYQWSFNGTNIAGATNSLLYLYDIQLKDTGSYAVVVTNVAGSVTSSNAVLTVTPARQAPPGLIGWWRGEGNVLDVVTLTSGYVTNGAGYGPGIVGSGFILDGINDQVIIPNAPALNFGSNQNFSVEVWIQAQPTPGNYAGVAEIVSKAFTPDGNESVGWSLFLSQGNLGFLMSQAPMSGFNSSIWASSGPNLQDGLFHHVGVTVDRTSSSGGKLYVDGALIMTFDPTQESGDLSTTGPLYIGCHDNPAMNCNFKGIIDEVSLYNRALTPQDVFSVFLDGNRGKLVPPFAPVITVQPVNRKVLQGTNVSFEVEAAGTPPLTYQWSFNGTNIAGATNNPMVLNNVQSTNAGEYAVVISNAIGSATSSNAVLTIILPQPAPQGLVGWWRGESNVVDEFSGLVGYETNGAGYGPGEVGSGFAFDGINGQVIIPNCPTLNFGSNQNFSVEAWIQAQATPGNYVGVAEIVSKAYTPDSSQSVGWSLFLNQGNLGFLMSQAPMTGFNSSIWASPGPNLQDGLFHHVGVTVDRTSSSGGKLYVDGVLIMTFDPTQESGDLSTTGPLFIGCHDNPAINSNFKGIIDEVSVYNRALTSNEITAINLTGVAGKAIEPTAPIIVRQPGSQQVLRGNNVTLEVGAGGSQPLAYQWQFNDGDIAGGTNFSLILTNVQFAQAGVYSVKVSNGLGSVTSSNVFLRVDFPPATVRLADASGSPSNPIAIPVLLMANGNENALSLSVNFDPSLLALADIVAGSGASGGLLYANTNLLASGRIGLIVALPSDAVFSAGTQEVARLIFNAASVITPVTTLVTFGNQPTLSQLSDVDVIGLAANYENGTVSIAAADFEGDVTPSPAGDKVLTMMDWVLEGHYVAGLDHPASASEYQRADCAPQLTRGDGAITVIDWVQVGRYAVGLDPYVPVGGPLDGLGEVYPMSALDQAFETVAPPGSSGSEVKILETTLVQGETGTVSVVLEAQGTENAVGFSLAFNPMTMSFVNASLGADAASALLNVNTNEAGLGRVGFALALSPGHTFGTGNKEILKLNFRVAAAALEGPSVFKFTDLPVTREVADTTAMPVLATFTHGIVDIRASTPTLQIRRLNDQVILSWPDWATNYTLQVCETSGTNFNWVSAMATTSIIHSECVVALPLTGENEMYRLMQTGPAIKSSSGTTNTLSGN
jgi:hypothetical protein